LKIPCSVSEPLDPQLRDPHSLKNHRAVSALSLSSASRWGRQPAARNPIQEKVPVFCCWALGRGTWLPCVLAFTSIEPNVSHDIICARMHRDIDFLPGLKCRGGIFHIVTVCTFTGRQPYSEGNG
jgi:hypothetical protein